jgi:hypothetical protein
VDVDAARAAARLKPLVPAAGAKPAEPAKPRGHARGQTTDDRRLQDKALRGIPCVGAGPGVIDGTRPGDSAAALEQEARDLNEHARLIMAAKMRQARDELKRRGETT